MLIKPMIKCKSINIGKAVPKKATMISSEDKNYKHVRNSLIYF